MRVNGSGFMYKPLSITSRTGISQAGLKTWYKFGLKFRYDSCEVSVGFRAVVITINLCSRQACPYTYTHNPG
jgi:hypothetical protein